MANENNNINELVSDDDVTAELEIPNFREALNDGEVSESDLRTYNIKESDLRTYNVKESDLRTFNVKDRDTTDDPETPTLSQLRSDLRSRKKTIGRLQFDIEQLRSKWMGLEAEIEAREKQTIDLSNKVDTLETSLTRKERLIKKRDRRVRDLKSEIRERQEEHQQLILKFDALSGELAEAKQLLQQPSPEPRMIEQAATRDLEFRLTHSEEYADGLRRQLRDLLDTDNGLELDNERLSEELQAAQEDIDRAQKESAELVENLRDQVDKSERLGAQVVEIERLHAEEIKTLHSKLDLANDTATENADRSEQLSSDLQDLRRKEEELQSRLQSIEQQYAEEIRTVRFELGEAQDTVAADGGIKDQLASELQDLQKSEQELRNSETELQSRLESIEQQHAEEVQAIRFELGEAQDTVAADGGIKDQLASELQDLQKSEQELRNSETELQSRLESIEQQHAEEVQAIRFELGEAQDTVAADGGIKDQLASELQDLQKSEQELRNSETELQSRLESIEQQHAEEVQAIRFELGEAQDTVAADGGIKDQLASELQDLQKSEQELRNSEEELRAKLKSVEEQHAEELRTLRFELGEAQETAFEKDELSTQLASDLVDTRSFKDELERLLTEAEEHSQARIDELQKEVKKLAESAESYEEKLSTKSEAIAVLLAELAKKSEQLDSIGDIEDVIHDIDDRISGRISERFSDGNHDDHIEDDHTALEKPGRSDRVTRVLVGTVDDQVLRFPLFKDRLTIGRTADNDIQLDATYISRRHAVIQTDSGATRIIDWGSKNGVYVNSDRIKEHFLKHGDIVTIGNARFRYEERKKRDS